MKLGFELLANQSHAFAPHHKYVMYIKQNETIIPASVGEDTFDYNGMILANYPIAATGRKRLHIYEPGLSLYYGMPSYPIEIPDSEMTTTKETFDNLTLSIDNNAIFSQAELQSFHNIRVRLNDRSFDLPLLSPILRVHWEGQGLFKIYLDSLIYFMHK